MAGNEELEKALRTHPCYNEDAHKTFARMHLPVAPRCNIQCNYCNRKYDCTNESRPGVTSEVLTPEEAADKIQYVLTKVPELKVIGIAGPGDPLANESTFRTLELVKERFPDLTLCISTNGLALPENAQRLFDLGVRFVTVTMNASDPEIGAKIYAYVTFGGKKVSGKEGAGILMEKQLEGIRACADMGMLVKVNIVMVPDVNAAHIPELVKRVKSMGAYIVNILPLIPVEGTAFENMRAPTAKERKDLMDLCAIDAKMMRHCKQCRADAIGLIGADRSNEFMHYGCKSGCGPSDGNNHIISIEEKKDYMAAVASSDGANVDSGFGSASRFDVYRKKDSSYELVRTINMSNEFRVDGIGHRERLEARALEVSDCETVVVTEIGALPEKILAGRKVKVLVFEGSVKDALKAALP